MWLIYALAVIGLFSAAPPLPKDVSLVVVEDWQEYQEGLFNLGRTWERYPFSPDGWLFFSGRDRVTSDEPTQRESRIAYSSFANMRVEMQILHCEADQNGVVLDGQF
jgi:hypothetical protein